MVSIFNSDDSHSFEIIKLKLREKNIQFIPKGDNTKGMKSVRFEIFVRVEDAAKANAIVEDVKEGSKHSSLRKNKKHNPVIGIIVTGIILLVIVLLFVLDVFMRDPS